MTPEPAYGVALYLDDVRVTFDGFKALRGLSLSVDKGELRCIIGPNGAGKTTMMDVITGKTRPDSGVVFFGEMLDLTRMSEPEIAQAGIGRKFQRPTVFENLTVWQNMELALKTDKSVWASLFARPTEVQSDRIAALLETVQLADKSHGRAGALSHGQKQWLEIGMLLAQEPAVLLLDEPVAGMTDHETRRTAELLETLAGSRSIVVVEHDMDFVGAIARKVTVLHEGAVLAEGSMAEVQKDARVIEVYLGR